MGWCGHWFCSVVPVVLSVRRKLRKADGESNMLKYALYLSRKSSGVGGTT